MPPLPHTAIIIPARYASTRLPGKPLAMIGGQTMLSRVVDAARQAVHDLTNTAIYITTEDTRIADHAEEIGVPCLMTAPDCPSGSDRVLAAARQLDETPSFVVNVQGDRPFIEPDIIKTVIQTAHDHPDYPVITPVHRLSWTELDKLRTEKQTTPFTGTTAIIDQTGKALWFSKNIIPVIRKEDRSQPLSPVYQHIGLYGFRMDTLEAFCALPPSHYEQVEGLEQLRLLEHGTPIHTVEVNITPGLPAGIDSPEDLTRAEEFLRT